MANASISIEAISIGYGELMPVTDLSLEVEAGEFMSLLGPSGCGKTTTLRAVAGFNRLRAGDIRIAGHSVRDVPANRRNIGMVYQDYALFPHMTVADNIGFGLRMRGVPADEIARRVAERAAQLKLSALAGRYPVQLSGGQQQRVALARAMAIAPSVMLLDEPMAALDRQLRSEMQFELRELQRTVGITTLFVTHDQEEALSMSDRIAVMNEGRILQVDRPDVVYDFPATRFVSEFIGLANIVAGTIAPDNAGGCRIAIEALGVRPLLPARQTGPVDAMFRPERVRFAAGGADPEAISFPCRIHSRAFIGSVVKYQVETERGTVLRVERPASESERPQIGESVHASVRLDDLRLFRNGVIER